MNELVSIIVPVYNVEKYVSECALSLINQTYKNIEIIFVDDGSTDGSGKICDDFAERYAFIRVLHQKNGGLSDARNKGLRASRGDYVVFVDSDDYVSCKFIEALVAGFESEEVDISCCAYMKFVDDSEPSKSNTGIKCRILTGEEASKFCYSREGRAIDVVAWNKLYRKSLFIKNGIEYPKGKYFEDLYTTFKLFYYARKVSISTEELYYYRQREGSIMSSLNDSKKYENMLEALKSSLNFYKEHSCKELLTLAFSMYCRTMIRQYYNTNRIEDKTEQKKIRDLLLDDYSLTWTENISVSKLNVLRRMAFKAFQISPFLISAILK